MFYIVELKRGAFPACLSLPSYVIYLKYCTHLLGWGQKLLLYLTLFQHSITKFHSKAINFCGFCFCADVESLFNQNIHSGL